MLSLTRTSAPADTDGDSLLDWMEFGDVCYPLDIDRDGDPDYDDADDDNDLADTFDELGGDGILDPDDTNWLDPDSDGDRLLDGLELLEGTDPLDPDSDDGGVGDGHEIVLTTDPLFAPDDRVVCGDGWVDPGEACDDDNAIDGDGCSATCGIEDGYKCSSGNGADGSYTAAALGDVVNTHAPVLTHASAGDTVLDVPDGTLFSAGDLIVVWQTVVTRTGSLDAVSPIDAATLPVGQYEFVRIATVLGDQLTLEDGLSLSYTAPGAQILTVPEFTTVTVPAGTSIAAPAWDGASGGALFFKASGAVVLNGTLDAAGAGLQGGRVSVDYFVGGETNGVEDEADDPTCRMGYRGEGVVVDPDPLPLRNVQPRQRRRGRRSRQRRRRRRRTRRCRWRRTPGMARFHVHRRRQPRGSPGGGPRATPVPRRRRRRRAAEQHRRRIRWRRRRRDLHPGSQRLGSRHRDGQRGRWHPLRPRQRQRERRRRRGRSRRKPRGARGRTHRLQPRQQHRRRRLVGGWRPWRRCRRRRRPRRPRWRRRNLRHGDRRRHPRSADPHHDGSTLRDRICGRRCRLFRGRPRFGRDSECFDDTPPDVPTVVPLLDATGRPTLTGTYDPSDLGDNGLVVTVDGVPYTLGVDPELTVDPGGSWALDLGTLLTPLVDGIYDVSVTQSDAAGNTAADGTPDELEVDTTAPRIPTVIPLSTVDTTPVLTGGYDPLDFAMLVVTVGPYTFDDSDPALTLDAGTGSWSLDLTGNPLADGTYDVSVTQSDPAGNDSSDTTADELVIDSAPPALPTVVPQVTNDNTPVLTGTYDPSDFAELTVDVGPYTFVTSDAALTVDPVAGTWSLDLTGSPLADDTYDVSVLQTDPVGNTATDTTSDELLIDTDAPDAPTVVPQITNDNEPTIAGTYDPTDIGQLEVSVGGLVFTDADGALTLDPMGATWSLDLSGTPLPDGTYDVVATQTDASGANRIGDSTTDELRIDTEAPDLPTVDVLVTSNPTPVVTGTYDPTDHQLLVVVVDGVAYADTDRGIYPGPDEPHLGAGSRGHSPGGRHLRRGCHADRHRRQLQQRRDPGRADDRHHRSALPTVDVLVTADPEPTLREPTTPTTSDCCR